jgi:hypothetical protein
MGLLKNIGTFPGFRAKFVDLSHALGA